LLPAGTAILADSMTKTNTMDRPTWLTSLIITCILILSLTTQSVAQSVQRSPEGFETFEAVTPDTTWLMKKYFFCMLERGDRQDSLDAEAVARIQAGHLAHLTQLGKDGKICLAGPFEGGEEWRGIVVYKVPTLEEALRLASADPAVVAGRLKVRIVPWWAAVGSKLD